MVKNPDELVDITDVDIRHSAQQYAEILQQSVRMVKDIFATVGYSDIIIIVGKDTKLGFYADSLSNDTKSIELLDDTKKKLKNKVN